MYRKIKQFIYLPIHKDGDHILGVPKLINKDTYPELYKKLEEDFNYISEDIKDSILKKKELHTINGPNLYFQLRTAAAKNKQGNYPPLIHKGHMLKDKYMAFYFRKEFQVEEIKTALLICLLISLWPLSPSANFFSSWINNFYYLPFGIYLYYIHKKV